jgi:hypothetical protein
MIFAGCSSSPYISSMYRLTSQDMVRNDPETFQKLTHGRVTHVRTPWEPASLIIPHACASHPAPPPQWDLPFDHV